MDACPSVQTHLGLCSPQIMLMRQYNLVVMPARRLRSAGRHPSEEWLEIPSDCALEAPLFHLMVE
jgi:hypothetical protein